MTVQRFVICSVARSGTNYLISKMLSSRDILLAWEPFNREVSTWFDRSERFESLSRDVQRQLHDLKLRNKDPVGFYERTFSPRSELDLKDTKALGYKIFTGHNPEVFSISSGEKDFKAIVIERRNRLASFSSELIARKADRYTGEYDSEQKTVQFDKDYFEMYMQATNYTFASTIYNLKKANIEYIHIFYEDFSVSDAPIQDALNFVGATDDIGGSWLIKQNSEQLLQRFSNPEAVTAYVEQKGFPFLS